MKIKDFEFHHGAVIVKLLKSKKPINMKIIETSDKWSTYTLTGDTSMSDLFITHRTGGSKYKREGGGITWAFSFSDNQISQIRADDKHNVCIALVCVDTMEKTYICFFTPSDAKRIFVDDPEKRSITVRLPDGNGKSFQIFKDNR